MRASAVVEDGRRFAVVRDALIDVVDAGAALGEECIAGLLGCCERLMCLCEFGEAALCLPAGRDECFDGCGRCFDVFLALEDGPGLLFAFLAALNGALRRFEGT